MCAHGQYDYCRSPVHFHPIGNKIHLPRVNTQVRKICPLCTCPQSLLLLMFGRLSLLRRLSVLCFSSGVAVASTTLLAMILLLNGKSGAFLRIFLSAIKFKSIILQPTPCSSTHKGAYMLLRFWPMLPGGRPCRTHQPRQPQPPQARSLSYFVSTAVKGHGAIRR